MHVHVPGLYLGDLIQCLKIVLISYIISKSIENTKIVLNWEIIKENNMLKRRDFMLATVSLLALPYANAHAISEDKPISCDFEICRSEEEWRSFLTEFEYNVMREEATESPFSSPLDKEYSSGTYICKGCELPLYSSAHKYNSGTGWPSFYQSLENAIRTKEDRYLIFQIRTEVHCRRCGRSIQRSCFSYQHRP